MKVAFFSTKPYDEVSFTDANAHHGHDLAFLEPRLTTATAALARGAQAVCAFVNDELHEAVLTQLADGGTRLIALRSAGFNHDDLVAVTAWASRWRTCPRTRPMRSPSTPSRWY